MIGDETVKTHLRSIYRKLGVSDRTGAVATALREGHLPVTDAPGRRRCRRLVDADRELALLRELIQAASSGPGVEPLAAAAARMITAATATDVCFVHVLDDTERSLTLAGCDAAVRQRGRQDPAAAGTGHLGLGGQPSRAGGDQPRQGVRPALPAVRVAARLGLHVDGVGADGDRSRRAGRGAQRAHRGAARVHRPRRRTAAGDRPADRRRACTRRGCTASWWPANARTRTSSSRSSRPRRLERRRLAGDIHDGISQRLVTLSYRLDAAARAVGRRPRGGRRAAGQGPRTGRPDAAGGPRGDRRAAPTGARRSRARRRAGQPGPLHPAGRHRASTSPTTRLPDHIEVALYRIAQECLQNVVKHAQATRARLTFAVDERSRRRRLEIVDDGVGFDTFEHPLGSDEMGGYGLLSMAERAEIVGGRLNIRSRPGAGHHGHGDDPAAIRR